MQKIRLIHWNVDEADRRAQYLRSLGFDVDHQPLTPAGLRVARGNPPDATVIDLSRSPSAGRDVAVGLRRYRDTRCLPLLFVDGELEKVERTRELLPDATYTTWDEIEHALTDAIAHPPVDPIVPQSSLAAYSGTPLPKKLGIKANSTVGLFGAPNGFEETLGVLPQGAILQRDPLERADVSIWFVQSCETLTDYVEEMAELTEGGSLWIAWPKKSSGVAGDLSQGIVREIGLAAGLVDYKVCSIDSTWSGLLFTRRKN